MRAIAAILLAAALVGCDREPPPGAHAAMATWCFDTIEARFGDRAFGADRPPEVIAAYRACIHDPDVQSKFGIRQ